MSRRYRIAWTLLALVASYAVPHRLVELHEAHQVRQEAIAHGP